MSANPAPKIVPVAELEPPVEPRDSFNETLIGNVHPPAWVNPEPIAKYNMVVLGAGTAGLVTAIGSAGVGAKVAIVEKHLMGGDCLNVGCVPSKALIRAAHACADARDAEEYGVRLKGGYEVDFPKIMERLRRLRAAISKNDSAKRYKEQGIDVFIGTGRFTGKDSVEVLGEDGKKKTLKFAAACVATGARAILPPIPGLKEAGPMTNETVFNLTELPKRLVVIGAGPIGCEMAQSFARFGSQVSILEPSDHIMSREDRDAAEIVQTFMIRDGVKIYCNMNVSRVERRGADKVVTISQRGQTIEIVCDAILVGAGRAPNVDGIGLEDAGVRFDKREGVVVDDHLQTTNPAIFAAGDVASKFKFTHAADFLARIVIENALFKTGLTKVKRRRASTLLIPWCTYTHPEVAHVGAYEPELKKAGIPFRTFTQSMEDVDRAILDGDDHGFVKVHTAAKSDKILGATIVARNAGDMIGELTLAMKQGIGLGTIGSVIHPYPTQGEAIRKVGDVYGRTRLTPFAKKVLHKLMAHRRR